MKKNPLKKITRNWFGDWSNEYDNTLGKIGFHIALLDAAVRHSGVEDGDRVLDIGCGTGLLSLKLLQKADCRITGIDSSPEMMALFQGKIKRLNLGGRVTCRLMDADGLDFPKGTFDRALSTVTLHHLKDKTRLVKNVRKILRPGGVFVIGEIDMDTTGRHDDPVRLRRILKVLEQEWVDALKSGGVEAFVRMYDNAKKHVFNEGEYCVSLAQWARLCRKAGFRRVAVKKLARYKEFGVVVAGK